MAQRSHVPKFGNWESEDVPYTAYFDKARKGRGGKTTNPNEPQENPEPVSDDQSPARPSAGMRGETEEPIGQGGVRRAHERRRSREEGDYKQFANSPAHNDNMNRRASNELAPQRHGLPQRHGSGDTQRRHSRQSAGSENSMERSPLHHHARISGRGSGSGAPSPAWEGKSQYDSSYGTPGRSRLKPREDESPEKGAAVPKFGEWDESNPASADGYTHIFNKVKEERHAVAGKVPGTPNSSHGAGVRRAPPSDSAKGCCFFWRRN